MDGIDRVGPNFFFPNFRADEKIFAATKKFRNARTIERTRCRKVPGERRNRILIDGYKIDAIKSLPTPNTRPAKNQFLDAIEVNFALACHPFEDSEKTPRDPGAPRALFGDPRRAFSLGVSSFALTFKFSEAPEALRECSFARLRRFGGRSGLDLTPVSTSI